MQCGSGSDSDSLVPMGLWCVCVFFCDSGLGWALADAPTHARTHQHTRISATGTNSVVSGTTGRYRDSRPGMQCPIRALVEGLSALPPYIRKAAASSQAPRQLACLGREDIIVIICRSYLDYRLSIAASHWRRAPQRTCVLAGPSQQRRFSGTRASATGVHSVVPIQVCGGYM
jgi:hypothetical protein